MNKVFIHNDLAVVVTARFWFIPVYQAMEYVERRTGCLWNRSFLDWLAKYGMKTQVIEWEPYKSE